MSSRTQDMMKFGSKIHQKVLELYGSLFVDSTCLMAVAPMEIREKTNKGIF